MYKLLLTVKAPLGLGLKGPFNFDNSISNYKQALTVLDPVWAHGGVRANLAIVDYHTGAEQAGKV